MTMFSGIAPSRRARLLTGLVAVSASVIAAGFFVVSSLASPANPAPTISSHPTNPLPSTAPATFVFKSSKTPTSFQCALDSATYSSCASPVTYSGLADGSHTFSVEAIYGSGSSAATGGPTSYTWDVAPPAPVITSGPGDPSADPSPEFQFADASPANVSFTCWLDSKARVGCGTSNAAGDYQASNLSKGNHCFHVLVTDNAGNQSSITKECWTIVAPQGFTVGGNLTSPLYPGVNESLDLTFTNPNPDAITIISIPPGDITIGVDSSHPGCASANFTVTQGLTTSVTIPGSQSTPISLSTLNVARADWPVVEMRETNTNQDACEGAQLTLTYSGIEATG
jgi:hypothetical protein